VKRTVLLVGVVVGLAMIPVTFGSVTSGGAADPSPSRITFDDAAQQVTFTIPAPPCAPGQEGCKWMLFVNEPKVAGKPVVGSVTGTTGALTVNYPPNFCGVLQADALTGPPYNRVYGLLHTVKGSNCAPISTPTTILAPTTTTTTLAPLSASTQPPIPPSASPAAASPPLPATGSGASTIVPSTSPPSPGSGAAIIVPSPSPSPAASGSGLGSGTGAPVGATTTQLPFTGANVEPLLVVGLALVALGLSLLSTRVSRRRRSRQLVDLLGHIRPSDR
jgi:hypothetical protein